MYFSDRVKLIRRTSKKDERGVPITDAIGNQVFTEETTEVWGDRVSPTRAESATAGQMPRSWSTLMTTPARLWPNWMATA